MFRSLRRIGATALAITQHEIADLDQGARDEPRDEDGLAQVQGIGEEHRVSGQAQPPEAQWEVALSSTLREPPLQDEATAPDPLPQNTTGQPDGRIRPTLARLEHAGCEQDDGDQSSQKSQGDGGEAALASG